MPAESASTRLEEGLTRTRGDDRPIAALACRQHGVVGRQQLLALGFSEEAIDGRLRTGRLHRLHLGVYAFGHPIVSRQGRWMAAVLASGQEAVLSHWSAAALWMVRPNSRSVVDVTTAHRSRSWKGIKRHVSLVPDDERVVVEGIPVTSVPRTILDVAATEEVDTVSAMLREAEYRNLWDRLSLWDLLERYPGKRGSRKVRVALERLKEEPAGRKRSPLEERFSPFLRRHRLPLPRYNDWIQAGDKRYQVDCHWPGTSQIVELDGWDGHKGRVAFREDKARDRRLTAAGYAVTHLTWNQIDDEAQAIAADLRTLLMNDQAA
jgi:very-short-patch-repair endonuclease/predicted transcriptional regulator of viral defense system